MYKPLFEKTNKQTNNNNQTTTLLLLHFLKEFTQVVAFPFLGLKPIYYDNNMEPQKMTITWNHKKKKKIKNKN